MSIRLIVSVVIAALLMTGGVATAAQVTEYGKQSTQQNTQKPAVKPAESQPAKTERIPEAEAKTIALKHAGLSEAEVTWERSEYDVERGIPEWDIDFRSGDWEYDYEIHAETGAVMKSEKDYDPVKPAETQPPKIETPKTEPPKTEKLSAEEAKTIALNHAGLQAGQVKGLRAQYDVDDGIPEWEVEFYADGMEYEYEIHAETGKIRSFDKDRDD